MTESKKVSSVFKLDNLHIVFWLFKDMSWVMTWKAFGVFMIAPTLICAFLITWKKRKSISDLLHNLAIIFWVSANSLWMVVEFFDLTIALKNLVIVFFVLGLILIGLSYLKVLMDFKFFNASVRSFQRFSKNYLKNY